MINHEDFLKRGFECINSQTYLTTDEDRHSLSHLQTYYQSGLEQDGPRRRAYLKLEWDRVGDHVRIAPNQCYFQSAKNNNLDGGKLRQFKIMNSNVLQLPVMQRLIHVNKQFISKYPPLLTARNLILGLHFVQYISDKHQASYSSPVGLHIDDEPLVFVHLVHLSEKSLGGDNLIARLDNQEITNVIRLETPMETMVLNNNCYHAVTPLGSKENISTRDIILFTVEPELTQVIAA